MNSANLITVEVVTATEEFCKRLLSVNNHNRHLRKAVVDKYATEMEKGRWFLTHQGIGIYEDGTLADGQHRLAAILKAKAFNTKLVVVRGLPEDAVLAIDQHVKRTARDVLFLAMNIAIDPRSAAVANVIVRDKLKWASESISAATLRDTLIEYADPIEVVYAAIKARSSFAAPYIAAFVVALRNHGLDRSNDVGRFIESLEKQATNDNTPENCLLRFITSNRSVNGGGSIQKDRFLRALNAIYQYLAGRKLSRLFAIDPRDWGPVFCEHEKMCV